MDTVDFESRKKDLYVINNTNDVIINLVAKLRGTLHVKFHTEGQFTTVSKRSPLSCYTKQAK